MSSCLEAKYYKTALRVHGSVTALLALELALPKEEILTHVRSTQYRFKVFKDMNCFMSLRWRHLDKAGTLLFCHSTIQR